MGEFTGYRRGSGAAVCVAILGVLTACSSVPSEPAPVFLRGTSSVSAALPPAASSAWHEDRVVIVKRGQTLGDIARTYRMPERTIIAANRLTPPYELRSGTRLVIPDNRPPPPLPAIHPMPPPSQQAASPAAPFSRVPLPPAQPESIAAAPPPTAARPAAPPPVLAAAAPTAAQPAPTLTPPSSASRVPPEVVPLDTPPRPAPAAAAPPPPTIAAAAAPAATLTPPAAAPPPAPAEAQASGRFPWPISGRVLANYGSGAGGARNEGINIAAPRGTAVRAIDGGTVAYVGNEVKGYGNLVLVKHANGWISAYAHLDDVLVKKGDTVGVGQAIARVGDSGGVAEPQLHFELRRGKQAVDPREFLAPAPSAGVPGSKAG